MTKKATAILALFLISLAEIYAQEEYKPGYIITLEQDTLRGELAYRSRSKSYQSCHFKSPETDKEYLPTEILGYGYLNDRYFSSQVLDGLFVEVLVDGEMSLYKSQDKYHIKKDGALSDLVQKKEFVQDNANVGFADRSRWRGIVNFLTGDCLDNTGDGLARLKYREKSLTEIVVAYNECRGSQYTVYKESVPWSSINFGILAGISQSALKVTGEAARFNHLEDSYSSLNPTAGVMVEFISPRVSDRLAFQGEVHFTHAAYSSFIERSGTIAEYHDTYIELNTLSIPISFKYSIVKRKFDWFLQAGINMDYHLDSYSKTLGEQVSGNTVISLPEQPAFEIKKSLSGFWGGIGFTKSIGKLRTGISVRYYEMFQLDETSDLKVNHNRLSLNLILMTK